MRATLRTVVQSEDLLEVIHSSDEFRDHFTAKKQKLRGVVALNLSSGQIDLRDQVAERLYTLRCRVVHAKQDGGGHGEDMLLPSSPEVDALGPDIELLRLVAERALITRAQRESYT